MNKVFHAPLHYGPRARRLSGAGWRHWACLQRHQSWREGREALHLSQKCEPGIRPELCTWEQRGRGIRFAFCSRRGAVERGAVFPVFSFRPKFRHKVIPSVSISQPLFAFGNVCGTLKIQPQYEAGSYLLSGC